MHGLICLWWMHWLFALSWVTAYEGCYCIRYYHRFIGREFDRACLRFPSEDRIRLDVVCDYESNDHVNWSEQRERRPPYIRVVDSVPPVNPAIVAPPLSIIHGNEGDCSDEDDDVEDDADNLFNVSLRPERKKIVLNFMKKEEYDERPNKLAGCKVVLYYLDSETPDSEKGINYLHFVLNKLNYVL